MLKKSILGLALIGLLASCGESGPAEIPSDKNTISLEHKYGTTIVVEAPERIVCYDIGALETLDELGIPVVGLPINSMPHHLEKYKSIEGIGDVGSVKEANFEKVHALKPDLIIISTRLETSYEEFSKIAPTIFYDIDPLDYMNSFKENTRMIGKLFNKEEEIESKLTSIDEDIQEVQDLLKEEERDGLIVIFNNGNFSAFGSGSRFGFIHDVLGLKANVADLETSRHGQKISNEFILEHNPDILFVVDRNIIVNRDQKTNPKDIENALIKQTKAYKNNQIVYLDPHIWYLSQGGLTSTRKMVEEVKNVLER